MPEPTATPCRSCGETDLRTFLSLGTTPLADALLPGVAAFAAEPRYPLDVAFCPGCSLVQILEEIPPEKLFVENYLYFSSFSDELLRHNRAHALSLVERLGLDESSLVVEVASNDGYFLKNFVGLGIPVLGIDPAPGQADAAERAGVPTLREFFGAELAARLRAEGRQAHAIVANNVMAHVPDLNGFAAGYRTLIADGGLVTIENPYVRDLIDHCEFDTIYHEHHCYFSCTAVDTLVRRHGLFLNHVEHFANLHGGTLRWHVGPVEDVSEMVRTYLRTEAEVGVTDYSYYADFARRVEQIRAELRELLHDLKRRGATIAAYGAAAKGSTMVNYVGIGTDLVDFVVDRNIHKHGTYMPGMHIPVVDPAALLDERPDYVLLLAWNFKDEIMRQQAVYHDRGGRFIVPVPRPEVV